jgi:hypothetical protein
MAKKNIELRVEKSCEPKCAKVFWAAFFGSMAAYIVLFLIAWLLAVVARGG